MKKLSSLFGLDGSNHILFDEVKRVYHQDYNDYYDITGEQCNEDIVNDLKEWARAWIKELDEINKKFKDNYEINKIQILGNHDIMHWIKINILEE